MDVYTFRVHDGVSGRNEEKTYHVTHFFAYSVYLNFLWQQNEKYPYSDSINIINPHGSVSSKIRRIISRNLNFPEIRKKQAID